MLKYSCAAVTKKGRRANNQDNYIINSDFANLEHIDARSVCRGSEKRALFAAVADGMGGEASGEKASYLAVSRLAKHFAAYDMQAPCNEQLSAAVLGANDEVCRVMQLEHMNARMGSTVVAVCILGNTLTYTNLGDSRLYMLRDGVVTQLTKDHTEGQVMLDAGILTPEQLKKHSSRNRLNRYLGIYPEEMMLETPNYMSIRLKAGDAFLLCSDGVCGVLNEAVIGDILTRNIAVEQKAELLVDTAFANGSSDNMTALVITADDKNTAVGHSTKSSDIVKYSIISAALALVIVGAFLTLVPLKKAYIINENGEVEEVNRPLLGGKVDGELDNVEEYAKGYVKIIESDGIEKIVPIASPTPKSTKGQPTPTPKPTPTPTPKPTKEQPTPRQKPTQQSSHQPGSGPLESSEPSASPTTTPTPQPAETPPSGKLYSQPTQDYPGYEIKHYYEYMKIIPNTWQTITTQGNPPTTLDEALAYVKDLPDSQDRYCKITINNGNVKIEIAKGHSTELVDELPEKPDTSTIEELYYNGELKKLYVENSIKEYWIYE